MRGYERTLRRRLIARYLLITPEAPLNALYTNAPRGKRGAKSLTFLGFLLKPGWSCAALFFFL
jgi:hypothetical protein